MINEITSTQAYQALANEPEAVLIDCRTKEEWQLLGTPDLSGVGKRTVLIEWQDFQGRVNDDFCDQVEDVTDTDCPVYVICRSGGRSRSACEALINAGFEQCFNLKDGFDGKLNDKGQRGKIEGWQVSDLPWTQG